VTGPATIDNEYGGIAFYGIHVAELLAPDGLRSRHSQNQSGGKNSDVIAQAEYDDKIVTLNLLGRAKYVFHLSAFGAQGWQARELQVTDGFLNSMKEFLRMLNEKKPVLDYGEMIESVLIMESIEESFRNHGKEILW
jgi:hypothetical protein